LRRGLFLLLLALAAGCAGRADERDIDAEAFRRHFADQRACRAFVDAIVLPAATPMAAMPTPEAMRAWLREQPGLAFAGLVARVQAATAAAGPLDPALEADQLAVASHLETALQAEPGFAASGCGPAVREIVMESLYLGLGGDAAPVAAELRRRGVDSGHARRRVLLAALMAGEVPAEPAR
jgi:hypothetical protein